jgi:hypothetical protein
MNRDRLAHLRTLCDNATPSAENLDEVEAAAKALLRPGNGFLQDHASGTLVLIGTVRAQQDYITELEAQVAALEAKRLELEGEE